MSKTSLVLTILGQDRPGLVGSLSELVAAHGGNWIESRMAHLAGQFAGILRVEIDSDSAESLTAAIKGLTDSGLQSVVLPNTSVGEQHSSPLMHLSLVGQDRAGIVREVSQVLAAQGVNVEELNTECTNAPNSGQPLFRATAALRLPNNVSAESLREALEEVASDLMVDITIE